MRKAIKTAAPLTPKTRDTTHEPLFVSLLRSAHRARHIRSLLRVKTLTFKYVAFERVHDYMRLGWVISGEAYPPHNHYAVVMVWLCGCPVAMPAI